MADLLGDYVAASPTLLQNYAAPPDAVFEHSLPAQSWAPGLRDALDGYQKHLGAPKTVAEGDPVFITGQQPGIFTGPLYTIYKAITALKLAERARESGHPDAVPIYWVGGDDHDFDEIASVHLLNKQHEASLLRLERDPGEADQSIFQIAVPPALHEMVDLAAAEAPGSEHRESVRDFLHESLEAAGNLSEWHARLMARLFRDTPLVLFTPELTEARVAAIPVFEREIETPGVSTKLLNAGGKRMEEAGYGAQVVKDGASCNFFVERDGRRCRVQYVDGLFLFPDTGERLDGAALRALLHEEPERFTANVALRCIVQQRLFPVRAYVAGPGELAYWGQLRDVFAHFNTPMPVVYPRMRAVLTSLKTNKLMDKLGLKTAELDAPLSELEELVLRATTKDPAMTVYAEGREALESELTRLLEQMMALGKSGRGAVDLTRSFQGQMEQALERLERGILRADENRIATVQKQLQRLTTERMPERKPQERFYTVFSWLFAHGWGLVPRLTESLDLAEYGLQEVEL